MPPFPSPDKMREAMKRDVEEWLQQAPAGKPVPKRLTRRAMAEANAGVSAGDGAEDEAGDAHAMDVDGGAGVGVAEVAEAAPEADPYDLSGESWHGYSCKLPVSCCDLGCFP